MPSDPNTAWLPERLTLWVDRHAHVLAHVYDAFSQDARWPDPSALQRQLVANGLRVPIASLLDTMPRELGSRSYSPSAARLSMFGLGCVPAARPLLQQYLDVIAIARQRYETEAGPAQVSRALVAHELGLGAHEAKLLSRIVVDDHPFLGDSTTSGGVDDWEFFVEDRILQFDDVATVDDLLELLAEWRLSPPLANPFVPLVPVAIAQSVPPPDPDVEAGPSAVDAAVVAMTFVGFVVLLLSGLAPSISAASAAVVGAAVLMRRQLWRRRPSVFACILVAFAAPVAGFMAEGVRATLFDGGLGAYRYFVGDSMVRRSVSPGGRELLSAPLGPEDVVRVTCIADSRGERWAKLDDGTWVPLLILTPEAGVSGSPRRC